MPEQRAECQNPQFSWTRKWLPVIVWATVISLFSTHAFTADSTGRFIIPVLRWFFPHASLASLERMHFFVRKTGHFTEYFIFSLLILRGIRAGRKKFRLAWMAIALLAVATYASFDEFHQRFVPGRTAAVSDVVLDTIGGAFAQLAAGLVLLTVAVREKRTDKTA